MTSLMQQVARGEGRDPELEVAVVLAGQTIACKRLALRGRKVRQDLRARMGGAS